MSNIIIKTNAVTKLFPVLSGEDFRALNNVSIEIEKRNLTLLKGKSDSGKTTLLNMYSYSNT